MDMDVSTSGVSVSSLGSQSIQSQGADATNFYPQSDNLLQVCLACGG